MPLKKGLWLNGKEYSLEEFQDGIPAADDQFERDTLTFCHQWLNGQNTFTIHTSGSTGKPKPINISRKQMELSARLTGEALQLAPDYNALVCLNTAYIAGQMMLVRCFTLGLNPFVVTPSATPLTQLPKGISIDFTAFVPYQMQQMLGDSDLSNRLDKLKGIIIGGAPIGLSLLQRLENMQAPVYATYGMTETVSHIALRRLNGTDKSPYFKTQPGVTISTDERGCLTIQSELTNGQLLITNDLVKLVSSDQFEWLGRIDNVINSGGVKIQVEQVELKAGKALLTMNVPNRFLIIGVPDEQLGEKVVMVIEGTPLENEQQSKLESKLEEVLSKYEQPKVIHYLPEFVETETGKVKRQETLAAVLA
ncbi:MAG: AMP-binding protein [Bacteroidota bacterium]